MSFRGTADLPTSGKSQAISSALCPVNKDNQLLQPYIEPTDIRVLWIFSSREETIIICYSFGIAIQPIHTLYILLHIIYYLESNVYHTG